ncbi:MAG TPA: MaoC family dehydratase [Dehalococcoidia bacterium]|nr:MaoC family dehydratase [Dehalococcoidia bacterium]
MTGQTATRSLTVGQPMLEAYAQITGDRNPLHFDEEFVAATRFRRLIAQGGIATGLLHALVAMDLPGAGSVFVRQAWTFPKPVYVGDTITAEGTVTSANERRSMYEMSFRVTNQEGEAVLEGEALIYQATPEGATP